jgi:plastocyanin
MTTTTDDEQPHGLIETQPVPGDESDASIASREAVEAHPYRERYLTPFLIPLAVVVGVVFFVLNVSRLFLANKGSAAIILAATITVLILAGAALLSAAPNLRSSSIALITVGALAVISAAGWLTVGHAEEKKEATVVLGDPVFATTIEALPALKFDPSKVSVPFDPANPTQTVIELSLKDAAAGQHTLAFDDPTVVWTIPTVNVADEVKTEKAGFPKAGDYEYHCTVPGHRQAGMEGTLTVTDTIKPKPPAGGGGAGSSSTP